MSRSAPGLAVEMYGRRGGGRNSITMASRHPELTVGSNAVSKHRRGTLVVSTDKGPRGRTDSAPPRLVRFRRDGLLDLLVCNYVKVVRRTRRFLQRRWASASPTASGGISRRHLLVFRMGNGHVLRMHRQERYFRPHSKSLGAALVITIAMAAGCADRQRDSAQQAISQFAQRRLEMLPSARGGIFIEDGKARAEGRRCRRFRHSGVKDCITNSDNE